MHPLIHSLIYSLTHSFTHSYIHSLTRSFTHSCIHSLTHSLTVRSDPQPSSVKPRIHRSSRPADVKRPPPVQNQDDRRRRRPRRGTRRRIVFRPANRRPYPPSLPADRFKKVAPGAGSTLNRPAESFGGYGALGLREISVHHQAGMKLSAARLYSTPYFDMCAQSINSFKPVPWHLCQRY